MATDATAPPLDPHKELRNAAQLLEEAFDDTYQPWLALSRRLQDDATASLAHMPTLSTDASDFGLMMAWVGMIRKLAAEPDTTLVSCDDPWLFRALAKLPGVVSGSAPSRLGLQFGNAIRGFLSRGKVIIGLARAHLRTRHQQRQAEHNGPVILVYGHPESTSQGRDAYFSDSLTRFKTLSRVMHTDCSVAFADKLAEDGRTVSLHAWGRLSILPCLLFTRWRPKTAKLPAIEAMLVQRAASIEGRGGSAAMTRWQLHCQRAWLSATRPAVVAWPWENHPWERAFCLCARRIGTRTIGYQHTVVGRHAYNQGADSNRNGLDEIPDAIALNGPAYRDDLQSRGIPESRLVVAGAHRISGARHLRYDPKGPVFAALSHHPGFARQMIRAIMPLAGPEREILAKDHPLSPYPFDNAAHFTRTRLPFEQLSALSAFIYCTGTSGLESALAGIPTLRFIPKGGVALDILPRGVNISSVTAETIREDLASPPIPDIGTVDDVFPVPDWPVWATFFETKPEMEKPV